MTGLIKAGDATSISARVRPLGARAPLDARPTEQVVPVELLALRREVESLSHDLRARDAELDRVRGDISRAFRDGQAEGHKAGLADSDKRRTEYLVKLERGIEQAIGQFDEALASLERLAVLIGREAIAKILGDPTEHAALLAAAVRHQLSHVEAQSVIRVLVSAEDFAASDELAALKAAIGRSGLDLAASDELKAGECRIRLSLGELDVGIGQQWTRLGEALEALAHGSAAS